MFPEYTWLFKKLICTLLWIVQKYDFSKNLISFCFSSVKPRPWGVLKPRLYLTRNSRHILMISMWKDFQKTFLLEVPRGMESQGLKKSFKWAIELNLLLKGNIIICRNKVNVFFKKRLSSCKWAFCYFLSLIFKIKVLHLDSFIE